ncbi:hypothetical protein AB4Y42_38060 [Paraburkholderia sp. EG286B]|uniref:hypothetical protein n=1 Tax=Paraburkholderia sp. EG286B TaxID=3237011 RepID=UPI0034D1FC59
MKVLSRGLFLLGLAVALVTTAGVVLNYSPVPYWDQWIGNVDWYMKANQSWWPAFWSLHNEHRLLFSRLIFYPDMRWFGGVNVLSFISNVVMCGLMALSLWRAAIFRSGMTAETKLATAGIILAFCFSWMQRDNFTWAFQNQWFAVGMFAILAFHALALSAAGGYSKRWFAAGIFAALTSAFSMANGSLAWPVFILLMAYYRFPLRYFAAAIVVALVEVFFYFHHADGAMGTLQHGTPGWVLRHDPVGLVRYAVAYLGSPIYHPFHRFKLATLAGLLVVVGTATGFACACKNRDMKVMPLLATAIFMCVTALATGIGRLTLGLESVFEPRYATNGLLAWASILLFWAVNLKRETMRPLVYGGIGVGLLSVLVVQPAAFTGNPDVLYGRLVAGQAMRDDIFDRQYMQALWFAGPNGDAIKPIVLQAQKESISILRPNATGYDTPPDHIDSTKTCPGAYDSTKPTETPGWQRAEGWTYADHGRARTVAITDASGKTVGSGVVGGYRPDAAAAVGTRNKRLGWVAFYRDTPSIHVFAKTGTGYCMIR